MKNTYKIPKMKSTQVESVELKKGITMEEQVARIMNNQADLERTAPLIYTERKDGVNPAHDIRTDRFEVALDGMDKATKSALGTRQAKMEIVKKDENGKPDSVQGTE